MSDIEIEKLAEVVHKAYCKEYEKKHGKAILD